MAGKTDHMDMRRGRGGVTRGPASPNAKDPASQEPQLNPAQQALKSMETSHKSQLVLRQKVAVIGDAAVGKTSLVQMFHSGGQNFPKSYVMTLGCDFCVKMVNIPEDQAQGRHVGVELYLFDTAGQSVFNQRQLAQKYWENVSSVIAVSSPELPGADSKVACFAS